MLSVKVQKNHRKSHNFSIFWEPDVKLSVSKHEKNLKKSQDCLQAFLNPRMLLTCQATSNKYESETAA